MTSDTPGLRELPVQIGDFSFFSKVNASGFGSMVIFMKGNWVVSLHTVQADGVTPVVDTAGLETLARMIAGQL